MHRSCVSIYSSHFTADHDHCSGLQRVGISPVPRLLGTGGGPRMVSLPIVKCVDTSCVCTRPHAPPTSTTRLLDNILHCRCLIYFWSTLNIFSCAHIFVQLVAQSAAKDDWSSHKTLKLNILLGLNLRPVTGDPSPSLLRRRYCLSSLNSRRRRHKK